MINSGVLRGLSGIEYCLVRGSTEQKIDALLDAFEFGQAGLALIIQALEDKSREVRDAAYWLLTESKAEIAKKALWSYYLPFAQMQCLHTITDLKLNPYKPDRCPDYFAISSDGRTLVCQWEISYKISTVQFWDLWTGQLIRSLDAYHHGMGLGENGKTMVAYYQHLISVENAQTGKLIRYFPTGFSDIRAFAVSPSEIPLVVCGKNSARRGESLVIEVWDYQVEKLVHTLEWEVFGDVGAILSLLISPDEKTLVSVSTECYYQPDQRCYYFYKLWNLQTGELVDRFEVFKSESMSGIRDTQTEKLFRRFDIDSLAVRPEGQTLASGTRDGKIKVWDLYNNEVIYSLPGCFPSAMIPDCKVLICCTEAKEILVWDLEFNQEICTFSGNTSRIQEIAISINREWIASYDAEQTIKIWGIA